MTTFALLRHFPTDWNAEGRLQGRTDRPLLPASRTELAGLALPAPWDRAEIIASPLLRARETAETLARGRPVRLDERLVEISWGDWEGRITADLLADPDIPFVPMEDWGWHRRPPGGESMADAWERVAPVIAELTGPTLLVAHRALMRVILARAMEWNFDGPEPFRIRKGRLIPMARLPGGAITCAGAPAALEARRP